MKAEEIEIVATEQRRVMAPTATCRKRGEKSQLSSMSHSSSYPPALPACISTERQSDPNYPAALFHIPMIYVEPAPARTHNI